MSVVIFKWQMDNDLNRTAAFVCPTNLILGQTYQFQGTYLEKVAVIAPNFEKYASTKDTGAQLNGDRK